MSEPPVTLADIEAACLSLRVALDAAAQVSTAVDAELTEVRHVRKPLYYYRIHADSISQRMRIEQIHCARDAVVHALERRGLSDRFEIDLQIRGRFSLRRRNTNG